MPEDWYFGQMREFTVDYDFVTFWEWYMKSKSKKNLIED